MRYDGWNRRVEYDDNVLKNRNRDNLRAQEPHVNQTLLQPSGEPHKPFGLTTARSEVVDLVAQQRRQQEEQHKQFLIKQQQIAEQQRILEDKRNALLQAQQEEAYNKQQQLHQQQQHQYAEQAILYQIKQQQILAAQHAARTGSATASAQTQATIQKLLLDLAKLNPQLALQTLQQFKGNQATTTAAAPAAAATATAPAAKQAAPTSSLPEAQNLKLVHNMGSIHQYEPTEFTQAPANSSSKVVKPKPK